MYFSSLKQNFTELNFTYRGFVNVVNSQQTNISFGWRGQRGLSVEKSGGNALNLKTKEISCVTILF